MTNTTLFVEQFTGQIFNPDCSYLTGMMIGSTMTIRYIMLFALIYFGFKLVDKLAYEPLLCWIKDKLYKKKIHKHR